MIGVDVDEIRGIGVAQGKFLYEGAVSVPSGSDGKIVERMGNTGGARRARAGARRLADAIFSCEVSRDIHAIFRAIARNAGKQWQGWRDAGSLAEGVRDFGEERRRKEALERVACYAAGQRMVEERKRE